MKLRFDGVEEIIARIGKFAAQRRLNLARHAGIIPGNHRTLLRFATSQSFGGRDVNDNEFFRRDNVRLNRITKPVIREFLGRESANRKPRENRSEQNGTKRGYHRKDFCSPMSLFPSHNVARHADTSPNFL